MSNLISRLKKQNIPGIVYGAVLIFIFFAVTEKKFLTPYNVMLIARNSCILMTVSIGMTMAVLIGQIDLSVGSVMSVSAVIVAVMVKNGSPLAAALLAAFGVAVLFGLVNGILIAVLKVDYWITTFATMSIGAGLALVISNGSTVPISSKFLDFLGNGKVFGVYFLIILTVIVTALIVFMLKKTKLGYDIYSIGGSENVAKLSGINVPRTRMAVYLLSSLIASLAGILITGMTNSASPIVGSEYSFNALAAVVIGGTSLNGGKGGVVGTVFGTVLLRIIASGLSMAGVPATWQKVIQGTIIVVIIVADVLSEKRKDTNGLRRIYSND